MSKYNDFKKIDREYNLAVSWNNLPSGSKYNDARFEINQATVKLERAGQQYCGGNNYWKAPEILNKAVERVIKSDSTIITRALALINEDRVKALADCREFCNNLNDSIMKAEECL